MKHILYIITFSLCFLNGFSQTKKKETTAQLASKFYSQKKYDKAAPLYKSLHATSKNNYYFKLYFTCLVQLKDYEKAEKEINTEIRKNKKRPEYYVYLGHILELQDRQEEAAQKFKHSLKVISNNKSSFILTANAFTQWGYYDLAQQTYLKGRANLKGEMFYYELARTNYYLRDYEQMMAEYLNYIKADEKKLDRVQSNLAAALRLDFNNELRDKFKLMALKRVQAEPNVIAFNRLLIWFFLQEGKFANALRQSIALDKRTGNEAVKILSLANMALNNLSYKDAQDAYSYLLGKGEGTPFYEQSYLLNLKASYLYFIQGKHENLDEGEELSQQLKSGLEYLGNSPLAYDLAIDYADLLAFYLDSAQDAIMSINKALKIPRLRPLERDKLKTKLADIYVYAEDPWEATLIYSQVIDANKKNTLGDEVKLKKARLGYYLGNFSWAKAQLDVLKASTSKLTANDAFELSLFIGENSDLDTTDIPLQMFSKADLLFFQRKDSLAYATIDSIAELYPFHSLVDDILMRKAKINIRNRNYQLAADQLQQILDDFSYELLADDALFMLANIYDYNFGDAEKALGLYKQMMVNHPGSIYVVESRQRFRVLRGDSIEEDSPKENIEYQFFEGI